MKTYLYKVYDQNDNFIKTWTDVTSNFEVSEEINTVGGEVRVTLGRKIDQLGEDSDLVINNKVKIYVSDKDLIDGDLIFQGYISAYTPYYDEDGDVEVVLYGFGYDLNDQLLDLGDPVQQDLYHTDVAFGTTGFNYTNLAQTFTPDHDVYLQSITLWVRTTNDGSGGTRWPMDIYVSQGNPNGLPPLGGGSVLTFKETFIDSVSWNQVTVYFDEAILLSSGTQYYFEVIGGGLGSSYINEYAQASDSNDFNGQLYGQVDPGTYTLVTDYNLRFSINGGTTLVFDSADPSDMLRTILDVYQIIGAGQISYTAQSLESTGTTTSYDFTTMTIYECIKKCLELAPPDWYFYINQGDNLLEFHKRSATTHHSFVFGKHIEDLRPEKTNRDSINTVYFTGKDNFYKKYVHGSPTRIKALNYVDKRVSQETTADTIANNILQIQSAPDIRLFIALTDDNVSALNGYDIETISIGQNATFRGFGDSTTSLWDVAVWDQSYWDFKLSEMETLVLQIVRLERQPGKIKIFMSTIPPDVSKRVEDINRRLLQEQTFDNPDVPDNIE